MSVRPSSSPIELADDFSLDTLRWDERGLVTVVVQDATTGAVLMVAWADREAVERTLETGRAHFWSRSRQELWRKGGTSGNELVVVQISADCDRDTLLVRARPLGPACHEGTVSCFADQPAALELGWLSTVLRGRAAQPPESSYTARLLASGLHRVAQKVGEEGVETVIAAMRSVGGGDRADSVAARAELVSESADLLYHLLVLFQATGVDPEDVARELASRHFGELPSASTSHETSALNAPEEAP